MVARKIVRILRISAKVLLLVYIFAVNLFLIVFFYGLAWAVIGCFVPFAMLRISIAWGIPRTVLVNLPLIATALYTLYCLSPLYEWTLRVRNRYNPLPREEKKQVASVLSDIPDVSPKLKIYSNDSDLPNAAVIGFRSIGLTRYVLRSASAEELGGILSHEIGHIRHYDYIYSRLCYALEHLGQYALYGIFRIPSFFIELLGAIFSGAAEWAGNLFKIVLALWWEAYKKINFVIYQLSRLVYVNLNKYAEYRCDTYACRYGFGNGLLTFLSKIRDRQEQPERPSFTEYMMGTHPATAKRIIRLEKRLYG